MYVTDTQTHKYKYVYVYICYNYNYIYIIIYIQTYLLHGFACPCHPVRFSQKINFWSNLCKSQEDAHIGHSVTSPS
jgi:hypothetical protein